MNKKNISYSLSDKEIQYYLNHLGGGNIIIYKDLLQQPNIDSIFKNNICVLLYENKDNFGHWCTLLRYPKKKIIEFFDPYGMSVDCELRYIDPQYITFETRMPHLSKLISESSYRILVNKTQFQKYGPNINTCGKWVLLRIAAFKKNINLHGFIRLFGSRENTHGRDFLDSLISRYF